MRGGCERKRGENIIERREREREEMKRGEGEKQRRESERTE